MADLNDDVHRRIAAHAAEFVKEMVQQWADEYGPLCGSPIETAFLVALITTGYLYGDAPNVVTSEEEARRFVDRNEFVTIIRPQAQIGPYRVDFLITAKQGSLSATFVVECDGHDFHEKTKAQASRDKERDRYLQTKKYRVYRFSGSDIHRDPIRCATEIWELTDVWSVGPEAPQP